MKQKLFLLMLIACLMFSCIDGLSISGTVENVTSGTIYLQKFEDKKLVLIDEAQITNGEFKFTKKIELPELYALTLDTTKSSYLIFLDKNPVTIKFDDTQNYSNTVVTGSELQDLFTDYKKQQGVKINEFIEAHPASLVSAYVLYREFAYRLTPEEILSNIGLLDQSLMNTQYVKVLYKLVETMQSVAIGKKAPDFTLNDTNDNPVKFSDHWGNGYILLDFWAAWCGPCRMENPNVVSAFNKFKDKGFTVFGVSLDRKKEDWIKAIANDSLDWVQVSDLNYWSSEAAGLYGIRSIPTNLLIDKNGIIVEKNLRGENLHKKLEELLAD